MTRTASPRAFEHDDARIAGSGGVVSDSPAGTAAAVRHGHRWIDKDGQLMHRTQRGIKLGGKDPEVVWVCAHGAPFLPAYINGRFEDHAFNTVDAKKHGLQTAREVFEDCRTRGLKVEWEVKDLRPFGTQAALDHALQLLAADAEAVFGAQWRKHVEVKVLNTLHGGLPYALRVLKAAHRAGFTTMLLNHRKTSVLIGPKRAEYVDQVRGRWHEPAAA